MSSKQKSATTTGAGVADVQGRLIGNLMDHWDLVPGDTKSTIEEDDPGFYEAMMELYNAVENEEFWVYPEVSKDERIASLEAKVAAATKSLVALSSGGYGTATELIAKGALASMNTEQEKP